MAAPLTTVRRIGAWTLALLTAAIVAGAAFVYFGAYDISATEQHTPPVYWLIEATMRRSVHMRSSRIAVPDLSSAATIRRGLGIYHAECERCHGAPGVSPERFALGLTPAPANLTDTARRWDAADVYWVVKHGIKMTGMPAWKYRLSEDDVWAVVAFVQGGLRQLTPPEYRQLLRESEGRKAAGAAVVTGARTDAISGKQAIQQYACATCHEIPGITGATKPVGPPLRGIASRSFIAGVLANTPENMVRWLRSPPSVDPLTAMPDLGITDEDARAMAAYLGTLTNE